MPCEKALTVWIKKLSLNIKKLLFVTDKMGSSNETIKDEIKELKSTDY